MIGPHVKPGFIDHTTLEHCSVHATLTERFGVEPVNRRAELSNNFSNAIDPDLLDNPNSPITLPKITIDEAELIQKLELVDTQSELGLMADNGEIPAEFDQRKRHVQEIKNLLRKAHEFELINAPRRRG